MISVNVEKEHPCISYYPDICDKDTFTCHTCRWALSKRMTRRSDVKKDRISDWISKLKEFPRDMGVYFRLPMLQNAAEARSSFLGGHNIAVLVDRSLSTEHERNIAAYLQVYRRLVRNR